MSAHEGGEGAHLRPPDVEARGELRAEEAADVVAPEPRRAHGIRQAAAHRRLHADDGGLGVAAPLTGVALRAGRAAAAPHERRAAGVAGDGVADRAVVAQRVEVVRVVRRGAVVELDVVGQRLAEVGLEDRDPVVEEGLVHALPPADGIGVGEVDEGPHPTVGRRCLLDTGEGAVRPPDEVALLLRLGEPGAGRVEVGQLPHRQAHALLAQRLDELAPVAERDLFQMKSQLSRSTTSQSGSQCSTSRGTSCSRIVRATSSISSRLW